MALCRFQKSRTIRFSWCRGSFPPIFVVTSSSVRASCNRSNRATSSNSKRARPHLDSLFRCLYPVIVSGSRASSRRTHAKEASESTSVPGVDEILNNTTCRQNRLQPRTNRRHIGFSTQFPVSGTYEALGLFIPSQPDTGATLRISAQRSDLRASPAALASTTRAALLPSELQPSRQSLMDRPSRLQKAKRPTIV